MTDEERRRAGRPREYDGKGPGAPKITIRFDKDVYEWLKAQPGGSRKILQELARERMSATKKAPPVGEAADSGGPAGG